MSTLRGSGPAPAGYFRCYRPACESRRDPFTGRFGKTGLHYHPVADPTPAAVVCVWCQALLSDGRLPAIGGSCDRCSEQLKNGARS